MTNDFRAELADRYRVEAPLGEGGMATVYRAHDLKHDRPVAVKVLRADIALVLGAERFLQEIRTTARLQHPHILPLLDSGAAAGVLYYVMPLVTGETLRARLARDGALPVAEAVQLTGQIAAALDAAHRVGVIHRDIKPENILLSDGLPLVADFGIALAVQHAGDSRLTETGVSLGTPAYMSPEQVVGSGALDARADQYSLACLVFEMIAGRPPYQGATSFATMTEHVASAIPPISSPLGPVPSALAQAIRRSLAKDPADRFASVAEFARALGTATSGPHPNVDSDQAPLIVVLPFENLSPDPDNAFFADGLTEEIISDLSKVKALRVISRTTAVRFKGTTKDVPTIARELGVRYVLEGTVRRAGNALRVTAQLIDGPGDTHLWAEKYGGTLEDVFEIQEKLAREIVAALKLTLAPEEARRVRGRPIENPVAYDCYLRARQLVDTAMPDAFESARALLSRAEQLVGEHPLILAAMANRLVFLTQNGIESSPENYRRALELSARSLALDPDCVEAHVAAGFAHRSLGELQPGVAAFRRALAIDPSNPDALVWLALLLGGNLGRTAEAGELARRAVAVGPSEPLSRFITALIHLLDGRPRSALEVLGSGTPHPWDKNTELFALVLLEDRPGLASWCDTAEQAYGDNPMYRTIAPMMRRFVARTSPLVVDQNAPGLRAFAEDGDLAWFLASALAAMDEREEAVRWLRRAIELGVLNYPFFTRHDAHLRTLAGYPPYDALMAGLYDRWIAMDF